MFRTIAFRCLAVAAALWLSGCAGTIQRETTSGSHRMQGASYRTVDVVLTDAARRLQADNAQFSVRELTDYVRRRMEALDLMAADGKHRVEITIESFRVRSAAAAVILGIMAGTDQIDGYVRVFDRNGKQVHGYKVNAAYGLGGWGGGQDGMRMNWLYDKFSELTVAELAGSTPQTSVAKGVVPPAARAAPASSSFGAAPPAVAPNGTTTVKAAAKALEHERLAPSASGYAAADNADAVPVRTEGKPRYRHYLTLPGPKAFAVYETGGWRFASGSADAMTSLLDTCAREGVKCWLYAVDERVVWHEEVGKRIGRTDQLSRR